MEQLTNYTWLIPAGPLLAFVLIILFTRRNPTVSWMLTWAGGLAALALGWTVAFNFFFRQDIHDLKKSPVLIQDSVVWLPFGEYTSQACESCVSMGVAVDPLTALMLLMVPFTVLMILIYSVGYHNYGQPVGTHPGEPNHGKQEPMFGRFFAFMSLFAGAMLVLVVADNLLLLFVGWEVMGLCSYLLIGFWYGRTYDPDPKNAQKLPPRYASIKAFMTTRVADVIMLLGIVYFYRVFGTLSFSAAFSAESLQTAATTAGTGALAVMALLIFAGTVGKSAQFPLHVWLPNAMEGPTPVSAVIHAAAMVSAGVYLILRIFPLIAVGVQQNPTTALVIAGIGAFTALFAATIAVAQDDVKGILAYSTISQLGFMVAAIGIGAYVAAAFHLITHAFFKALLFLGSGSIIHGMEHGAEHVHDHHTDPQDVMNMGGLRHKMPITFWTFVIGGAALSGFPIITAGFWSKDEILAEAWGAGTPLALFVFFMLATAALLTAFYTTRQISLVFLGQPRTPLAGHAHESNRFMTIPLILLSIPALFAGFMGVPEKFPVLGPLINNNWIHHFVGTTVYDALGTLQKAGISAYKIHDLEKSYVPLFTSLVVALGGIAIGWMMYGRKPLQAGEEDPLIGRLGPVHTFLRNKWYIDEFYQVAFIRPVTWFSEKVAYEMLDKGLIDGTLHLIAGVTWSLGEVFRRVENAFFNDFIDSVKDGFLWVSREFRSIQTGKIQEYILITSLMAGTLTLLVLYITGFFQGWFG